MRRVLRAPGFARLLAAQGVTGLGDWVGTVAFIAAARELTGSPLAVGAVLVIRLVPPIFAAPVGGALADRFDRRTVMAVSSAGQAALIAAVPFVGIAGLYVLAFAQESLALAFFPARDAMVPDLVAREDLPQANGLIMASSFASIPFAFALFSGLRLVATHTPEWVPIAGVLRDHPLAAPFFFDAATFAACGALVLGLPASRSPRREDEGALLRGSLDGFRLARGNPALRALGLGVAVAMFGGGVLFAVGISFVHGSLSGGDVEFGFLASLWGLGMALGLGAVRLLGGRAEGAVFRGAVGVCGAVLVFMGLAPVLWLSYLAAVVFGIAFSVAVMLAMSLAQALVAAEVRGRLLGAVHLLFRLGLALGALGIGGVAAAVERVRILGVDLDGNQVGLVVGGLLIAAGAAAARGVREATVHGARADPG